MSEQDKIQLFENQKIRTAWDTEKEEWYFSVTDVIAVLTEQPTARGASNYWAKLKQRLKEEGADELLTNCQQLKMIASDGKRRATDVATTEQLLRIIQSIPSPKAEPFRLWLAEVGRERIEETIDPEQAIDRALETYLKKGYSEEWVEEAARRGLPNIKSMVEASETLTTEKSIKLFEKFGIFTKAELESREEVLYETYSKTINIEALTMVDMAKKQYIPAVMEYTRTLADTVLAVKSAGADATVQTTVLKSISEKLAEAQAAETALEDKLAEAAGIEDPKKLAFFYKDVVHTAMDDLRTPVDELEMMVDKKVWPVPTYGDLIFEV